jgi:putative phosphoesterase
VERLREADLILHAGDFVAANVLDELRDLAPVEAVYGNMDEPALQEALPERLVVSVEGVRIGLVHIPGPSAGREERLVGWFPDCGVVVYGHTHVPQLEQHHGFWILNPGSPTERRRAPSRSMASVEVDASSVRISLHGLA